MLMVQKKEDMGQKDKSNCESSTKASEIRAFFDLVDREAHRLQLLNEKTRNSDKVLTNNSIAWQPSFQMEDFNLPPKRDSNGNCSRITSTASTSCAVEGTCDEEKEKRGLKRPMHLVDLAPLHVSQEKLMKGDSTKFVICDLNKEAEPTENFE